MTRLPIIPCLLSLLICLGVVHAQPRSGAAPARGDSAARADALPLGAFLDERLERLDRELAATAIQRAQVPPDQVARIDLEIDLRILQRWTWDQMSKAQSADLQCALYARGLALEHAAEQVRHYLAARPGLPPAPTQTAAMARLHELTFTLEDLEDMAALDKIARHMGAALLEVVAEQPVDLRTIPPMRPRPLPRPTRQREQQDDAPPTPGELIQHAHLMTVSQPLRAQLVAVGRAAEEAAGIPQMREEADRLHKLLIEATELAEGLASNTAVAPEERMRLESQLTEALALSADRRLKSAGDARMAALRPYRQTLTRVGRLQLTPEQRTRLAAALNYAQNNPDQADAVFSALDRHRHLQERYRALPPESPSEPHLRRAIDELRRQFGQSDGQFYEVAARMGAGGIFASTPEELAGELEHMQRSMELLEILHRLPQLVQALAEYRPRPPGGLERRVATAAVAAAAVVDNAQRQTNEAALRGIAQLGTLAEELARQPLSSLDASQAQPFTGGQAAAFDERWRGLVQELASAAASGAVLDPDKLDRLRQFKRIIDGVRDGIELVRGEVNWAALSRWADWTMHPDDFTSMLTPLQHELRTAVEAVASGQGHDLGGFQRRRDRYAPIIAFVRRANQYADQVGQLPTGLTGSCAKLMTPMAGQPFATERFAGLATRLWVYQEAETAQRILQILSHRVAPEVGMRPPGERRR